MANSFFTSFTSNFSKMDIFGKQVEFLIIGENANKTFIGALITIICLTLSIYLTVPTFKDFINMTDPTLLTSYEYDTTSISMSQSNFYFSVGFYSHLKGSKLELSNSTNNYTALLNTSDIQLECNDCDFSINQTYYEGYYYSSLSDNSTNSSRILQDTTTSNTTYSNNTGWKKPTSYLAKSLLEQQLEEYSNKNISNSTFYLVSCENNNSTFPDTMRIKSVSQTRSQDIAEIMRTYSFCFPNVFSVKLSDGSASEQDQTLSAQVEYRKVEYIPKELQGAFTIDGAVDPSTGR
jgi:hypothetical protein